MLERDKYTTSNMATTITIDRANVPHLRSHRIGKFEEVYENEILTDLNRPVHCTSCIHPLFSLLKGNICTYDFPIDCRSRAKALDYYNRFNRVFFQF